MPSIFSRIVSGELPAYKVAEDDQHLAFLDITPLVEGHTLVIPKKEIDYIFDLPPQELAALFVFAQRVAEGVRAAVPCQRIGTAVIGLEVPHAHVHLIPLNQMADMNFANPKIKVPEARMQELAAAIAAQVPADAPHAAPAPLETKGARETAPSRAAAAAQATVATTSAPATSAAPTTSTDPAVAQLQQLAQGLYYVSESDAPLEVVSYPAPAEVDKATVLKLAGLPPDTPYEEQDLLYFLRNHTADDGVLQDPALANRYKALQMFMKQELDGTVVYRLGSSPQIQAYALGQTAGGELAGFKTVLTET